MTRLEVAEHVLRMATDSAIRAVDGSILKISADSICVHGDSPGAVAMAAAVQAALSDAGITIKPLRLNRVRPTPLALRGVKQLRRVAAPATAPPLSTQAAPPHT